MLSLISPSSLWWEKLEYFLSPCQILPLLPYQGVTSPWDSFIPNSSPHQDSGSCHLPALLPHWIQCLDHSLSFCSNSHHHPKGVPLTRWYSLKHINFLVPPIFLVPRDLSLPHLHLSYRQRCLVITCKCSTCSWTLKILYLILILYHAIFSSHLAFPVLHPHYCFHSLHPSTLSRLCHLFTGCTLLSFPSWPFGESLKFYIILQFQMSGPLILSLIMLYHFPALDYSHCLLPLLLFTCCLTELEKITQLLWLGPLQIHTCIYI